MPSVAMNPIFEELASAYPDALFLTVDVDEAKVINSLLEPWMILLYFFACTLTFSIYIYIWGRYLIVISLHITSNIC